MRMRPHLFLVVEEVEPRREGDVDPARVVAVDQPEMAVADVAEAMDVIREEGLQDTEIVDLLQDEEIRSCFRDRQGRELPLVVLEGDCDGPLDGLPGLGLRHIEQRQGGPGFGAFLGAEAVTGGEISDVESADAQTHERVVGIPAVRQPAELRFEDLRADDGDFRRDFGQAGQPTLPRRQTGGSGSRIHPGPPPNVHPFYKWAAEARPKDVPRWNFHKYLIGRNGYIADVFPESVEPADTRVKTAIARALSQSVSERSG